jgi:hypothetical protein
MPTHFAIDRIISTDKKGKMQVTVRFNNKTVTRHLQNMQGKHPDDSLPSSYNRRLSRIADMKLNLEAFRSELAKLEKIQTEKPKKETEEKLKYLRETLPKLQEIFTQTKDLLKLDMMENPLTVTYHLEAKC